MTTEKKKAGRPLGSTRGVKPQRSIRLPQDTWDHCRAQPEGAPAYLTRLVREDQKGVAAATREFERLTAGIRAIIEPHNDMETE